ncbi:MAG TPA: ATP synthase subunit I [Terriglobia bacterium]|nr:ATP synthase subunit I [Terriglobia bacterium]
MMADDFLVGLDRRLNRSSLVVAIVAVAAAFFLYSAKAALSIAAGAVLSYINFHWLKQAIDFVVLQGAQGGGSRGVALRFVARYALIAVFLYVTIRSSALELIFVFAGLLVYVAAILIECVSEVARVLIGEHR